MKKATLDTIFTEKVIAIVRGIPRAQIAPLAQALLDGGLCCMEITFDQSGEGDRETTEAIRLLTEQFGQRLCLGAGTVMTVEEVRLAKAAGARYIISPNTNAQVIRETNRLDMVSIPGAMTPTETAFAWDCGADIVKLFPAGVLGAAYVQALKAPLRHIPVTAVGGITPQNIGAFLRAGAIGAGVGGKLVSAELAASGQFERITELARQYAAAVREEALCRNN